MIDFDRCVLPCESVLAEVLLCGSSEVGALSWLTSVTIRRERRTSQLIPLIYLPPPPLPPPPPPAAAAVPGVLPPLGRSVPCPAPLQTRWSCWMSGHLLRFSLMIRRDGRSRRSKEKESQWEAHGEIYFFLFHNVSWLHSVILEVFVRFLSLLKSRVKT